MPTHISETRRGAAAAGRAGVPSLKRRVLRGLRRSWEVVVLCVLGAALVAALTLTIYQRFNLSGPYRVEYEGRIVRKSTTMIETNYGSRPVLRLHLRGMDGAEFDVIVNRDLYERADEGMWIKRSREGTKLSREAP